jgi:hypothetical protein
MDPVPCALVLARHSGDKRHEATSTLLASGCRLLVSTPGTLVSGTSISCAIPSPEEGTLLAERARELAARHRLIAAVKVSGNRFRVRFARMQRGLELPNDGE